MIQCNVMLASVKGDNVLLQVELAMVIRTICKSIESEGSKEDAFNMIKECGELAFIDSDIDFIERITEKLEKEHRRKTRKEF